MTSTEDYVTKLIYSEIKKRRRKKYNKHADIIPSDSLEDNNKRTLNNLEDNEINTSLTRIQIKEKKSLSKISHKDMKNHETNTKCDIRFQKYFENNSMIYTNKTNNSKIYKCNICEKSFKHHSALKKHEAKTHNLIKEPTIITADISNTFENDEAYTSLLKTQMKKMKKRRKEVYKVMTEELMPSNKIVKHKENTICDLRPKEYLDYNITAVNTEETYNIEIYKCDVCEKSFECDSALNKHKRKAHILNNDTTVTATDNISQNSDNEEFILFKKCNKKMKKIKEDSKVGIQFKTEILSMDTKNHKLYTVAKVLHKEQLKDDTEVINTNETNKSNLCLNSFECNSTKAKDHNKRKVSKTLKSKKPVVTSVNTLNSPENEKECKLLLKTLAEKTNNKKNLNKVQIKTMVIKKVSEQKKCDEHKEYVERNCIATEHKEEINTDKIYKCNVYKKTYDILSTLNEQKTTLDIKCNICSKLFSTKFALSKHYILHTGERPYVCDVCGKTFVEKFSLTTHYRLHTGERPYTCDVCGKTFVHKPSLISHYKLHTGERPYTCDDCGKTFVHKSNLSRHYRLHTGEKPHKCDVCNRMFSEKRTLTVHYRLHTGERPYTCDICGKSFIQKCDLTTHYKWHTGEKTYWCNVCGIGFMEKRTLTIHNRLHTGEKPYKCSLCERSFTRNSSLRNHIRSVHEKFF